MPLQFGPLRWLRVQLEQLHLVPVQLRACPRPQEQKQLTARRLLVQGLIVPVLETPAILLVTSQLAEGS